MPISILIAPTFTSAAQATNVHHLTRPKSQPTGTQSVTWEDEARREHWEGALISYLRANWRRAFPIWSVINRVVAESRQPTRMEVRVATRVALKILGRLIRQKRIFLYRRRLVAILDLGTEIIPLGK